MERPVHIIVVGYDQHEKSIIALEQQNSKEVFRAKDTTAKTELRKPLSEKRPGSWLTKLNTRLAAPN